jgi:hypothetical protein
LRESYYAAVNGFYQSDYLAFYDYFREVCGLRCCDRLLPLMRLNQSAGWWIARRDVALISERPTRICRDERGRLHAEDGAAVLYPDGWGVWAWHGRRVPERIIAAPETLTVAEINALPNAEVRRVAIQRYGQLEYFQNAGAKQLARDDWGTLYRVERPGDTPMLIVQVMNSTPEPDGSYVDYFLRVPPTTRTPQEGVAWSFGKGVEGYAPLVQT